VARENARPYVVEPYDMNNSGPAASIALPIGPLTIGNTVVTTWGKPKTDFWGLKTLVK